MTVVDLNLNENQVESLGNSLHKCLHLKILRLQNNRLSLNSVTETLLAESQVSSLLLEGNLFEMKALADLEGWEQFLERQTAMRKKLD